ncbi:hypothetical protein I79_004362 [Cricetulus griseus]|uniref:Uncharacterized protein n=1 Tax=Cricetulus griseus TaxID=10029 RepID=G3H2F2_CRIGR|nr:hypothetical protein I79_004362 [Cricetulus griseus]
MFPPRETFFCLPVFVVDLVLYSLIESYSTVEVALSRHWWADCHPNSILYVVEGRC